MNTSKMYEELDKKEKEKEKEHERDTHQAATGATAGDC